MAAFQPFYQETFLEQEVNTDLIYKTQKELRSFAVYSDADVDAFAKEYFRSAKQDKNAVGRMSSILKPVADRYNQKTQAERYQFRRLLRSLVVLFTNFSGNHCRRSYCPFIDIFPIFHHRKHFFRLNHAFRLPVQENSQIGNVSLF